MPLKTADGDPSAALRQARHRISARVAVVPKVEEVVMTACGASGEVVRLGVATVSDGVSVKSTKSVR